MTKSTQFLSEIYSAVNFDFKAGMILTDGYANGNLLHDVGRCYCSVSNQRIDDNIQNDGERDCLSPRSAG